ncbi:hypothetical protein KY335_04830 [Candidatus Woesearchaeota archaeon]|nr:hypothetical protein [Candidatus Woesearchaeota archaeon]
MEKAIDFQKHLEDCLRNPPEDPDKLRTWEGFLAAYKLNCLLIEEAPKIEEGLVDDMAFYSFEDFVVPFFFHRGNYVGSIKFSEEEEWKGVVVSWLFWLKTAIEAKDDAGRKIIDNNIDILESVIGDPLTLVERPYPFLGHHQNFGQIILTYEDGNFFMDYFYHFSSNSDKNHFNSATLRTTACTPGGGIIGIDRLEHSYDFIENRARQVIFRKLLKIGEYNPLTKEQVLQAAKDCGIDYHNKEGLSIAHMNIPHRRLPLHKKEDFAEINEFMDRLSRMRPEYMDDDFDSLEED